MVTRSDPLGMQLGLLPHLHQSLYSPPLPLLPQELSLHMQCGLMGGANMYSHFRVFSPDCTLHSAIAHVIKVWEPQRLT